VYLRSYEFIAFASPCKLAIVCANKQASDEAASEIFKEAKRLESKYSFFLPSSVIGRINGRDSDVVTLDDESREIIQKTFLLCEGTNFVFDIALAGTLKTFPHMTDKAFAELKHIQLSADKLIFSNPITKIDLGGIIKEYALDSCATILHRLGITGSLVDFGGDIYAHGTKNGDKWKIGIKNPKSPSADITVIELQDMCVTTSGHYERDGHIITTKSSSKYIQASCIGRNAMTAGVFSTAFLAGEPTALPPSLAAITIDDSLRIETLGFS